MSILLHEEPPQTLGTDFRLDALRIQAGTRLVEESGIAEIAYRKSESTDSCLAVSRNSSRLIAIEYASWPVEQPGTQTRIGWPVGLAVDDRGEDLTLEILEHLRIAEEAGHVDEDVAVQRLGLVRDRVRGTAHTRAVT